MDKKVSSTPNRTRGLNDFTIDVSSICPVKSTIKKNSRNKFGLQSSNSLSSSGKLDDIDHLYLYSSYILATFTEISCHAYKKETENNYTKKLLLMHRLLTDQMKLLNDLKLKQQEVKGDKLMKEVEKVIEEDLVPVVQSSGEFLKCGSSFSNLVKKSLSIVKSNELVIPSAESDRLLLEADLRKCVATTNQVAETLKQGNDVLPRLSHLCDAIKTFSNIEKDLSSLDSTLDGLEEENLSSFVNYLHKTEDERDNACKSGKENYIDYPL